MIYQMIHYVLNHLYINEGQEETFEQKFLQRNKHLKTLMGLKH